jgi:hypothetical protein
MGLLLYVHSPEMLSQLTVTIFLNPCMHLILWPNLISTILRTLYSYMYQVNPRDWGTTMYTSQEGLFNTLVRRDSLRLKPLRRWSRENCHHMTFRQIFSEECRGPFDISLPLFRAFARPNTRRVFRIHQRAHCSCQSLHVIPICPYLSPCSWYSSPHHLTSWLQRQTAKLVADLISFFLRQILEIAGLRTVELTFIEA